MFENVDSRLFQVLALCWNAVLLLMYISNTYKWLKLVNKKNQNYRIAIALMLHVFDFTHYCVARPAQAAAALNFASSIIYITLILLTVVKTSILKTMVSVFGLLICAFAGQMFFPLYVHGELNVETVLEVMNFYRSILVMIISIKIFETQQL